MRKVILCGNWKMNKTIGEAKNFLSQLEEYNGGSQVELLFSVSPTLITTVAHSKFSILAQNFYPEEEGAFTGESSYIQILDAGADGSLIGHSERREYFNETDELVAKKVEIARIKGLKYIVCVGESKEQRESGKTKDHIGHQLDAFMNSLDENSIVAYEPIWAIGTGLTASAEQAQEVHNFIRNRISEKKGEAVAEKIRILYGGSVKPENIKEILARKDIDGALVGGASLRVESVTAMLDAIQ